MGHLTSGIDLDVTVPSQTALNVHTDSGDIDLTLPGSASFNVQATTNSGDIASDFAGVNVQHNQSSGAQASGRVGSAPYAQVTITTSSGDIHLYRAG